MRLKRNNILPIYLFIGMGNWLVTQHERDHRTKDVYLSVHVASSSQVPLHHLMQ